MNQLERLVILILKNKDFTAVKVLFFEDVSTDNIISKYFMPFSLISEIIHPR